MVGKEVRVTRLKVAGFESTLSGWFEVTPDRSHRSLLAAAMWRMHAKWLLAGFSDRVTIDDGEIGRQR